MEVVEVVGPTPNQFTTVMVFLRALSLTFLAVFIQTAQAVNFGQCLAAVNNMIIDGKMDNRGNHLPPTAMNATAITYKLCLSACGPGPEPFQWATFAQEFSSWVLPWLSLVSQLPFGANDKLDNLESMLLTVGSPALAAYSLALTVMGGRWLARLFTDIRYPNARNAVKVFNSLQYAPLRVDAENGQLASLVVLPQNDQWWEELVAWLECTPTWSIAAATSVAWVMIAYVFTLVDYFSPGALANHILNVSGEGVGSIAPLWLWLLPIVVGWMQIAPICEAKRLRLALDRANSIAYVARRESSPRIANSMRYAITLKFSEDDGARRDECSISPIFNYARFLPWVDSVLLVSNTFRHASERSHYQESGIPNDQLSEQKGYYRSPVATSLQVEEYCMPIPGKEKGVHEMKSSIWPRMFMASATALMLQWGTTGAAVLNIWYTPTVGLGCKSGAYFTYGLVSTLVWLMLLTSSLITYYLISASHRTHNRRPLGPMRSRILRIISIFLRRTGKIIASLNAVWIVAIGMLQFSNVFDNCYCNSSVIGLGRSAYSVILLTPADISGMHAAWVGGFSLSAAAVAMFAGFVMIFIKPTLPPDVKHS